MQGTMDIFSDRKEEIELYYSILLELISNDNAIQTINNHRFIKILKSNFILMLYNLVEACIVNGMLEIYESIKNDECKYEEVIEEIQNLWAKSQISQIYGPATLQTTYNNKVQYIISSITQNHPIVLTRDALKINGNLDANRIKKICDAHRIRYRAKDEVGALYTIKLKRNDLSHGDVSFSDCARDFTLSDLEHIKDTTIEFINCILQGMNNYYFEKGYKMQGA